MLSATAVPAFLFGGAEILILVAILVLLFWGPKKLPELARSTGEATQEWKKGRQELDDELENEQRDVETVDEKSSNRNQT